MSGVDKANHITRHVASLHSIMIPMTAEEYYIQGNQHRRNGDYQAAMNAYMEAIALDPESPAVEALRMLQDIMDYYCKDVYNP